ncbi:MAG: hypothetical protein QOF49_29 [Chloroflexota bacterium]|jgi:hypothetical protein|nr:hypothetical protein [Chloroflexota bacterium]
MTIVRRERAAFAGLAVLGLLLSACGAPAPSTRTAPSSATGTGSASTAPSVASASGAAPSTSSSGNLPTTGRIAVADKGFAITLPGAWTRVELGADAVKNLMAAGASALPKDMQDLLGGQVGQMAASGVSFFALRQPSAGVAPGTTLNILSLPSLGVPLDTFESLMVAQVKAFAGQDAQVATARVRGPAGEFLRLTYDLKVGAASVGTVQYLFSGPTKQYVISCGTPGPIGAIQAECEGIATSLEVL